MDIDFEELDDRIACVEWRWVNSLVKLPVCFKSEELEDGYEECNRKREVRFFTKVLMTNIMFRVVIVMLTWEHWLALAHGAKLLNWITVLEPIYKLAVAALLYFLHRAHPLWFTAKRRFAIAMITIAEFYVLSSSTCALFLGVPLPFGGDTNPPLVWASVSLIVITTVICNTSFSRSSISWVLYPASMAITMAVGIPMLAAGKWASTAFAKILVATVVQVHMAFMAQCSAELNERRAFLHLYESKLALIKEKILRVNAERQAEETAIGLPSQAQQAAANEASACTSQISYSASMCSVASMALQTPMPRESQEKAHSTLARIGTEENWIIHSDAVIVLPDHWLSKPGVGGVVVGLWNLTPVALKVPASKDPMQQHSLAVELGQLCRLKHPGILSLLGVCTHPAENEVLLVEEFVVGDDLSRFMKRLGNFATKNVQLRQHLLLGISSALHYLHTQEPVIIHGDLRPHNIMVESNTLNPKITDVGLACHELTQDLVSGGTLIWQEPELRNRSESQHLSARSSSDVWAFGAVAFFTSTGLAPNEGSCISGTSAFEDFGRMVRDLWAGCEDANTSHDLKKQFMTEPLDLPACRSLCSSCMHPDQEQRPTAQGIHRQLREMSGVHVELSCKEKRPWQKTVSELRGRMHTPRSHPEQVQLPVELLHQIRTALDDQASLVKTSILERGQSCDEVASLQTLHAIIQMLSWEAHSKLTVSL